MQGEEGILSESGKDEESKSKSKKQDKEDIEAGKYG